MRGIFGLLSFLICALIIAYVWSLYTQETATVAPPLHDKAEQLSGRSAAGIHVSESFKTEDANDERGRFKGLLVTEVTPGGGMQTMYGLKEFDGRYDSWIATVYREDQVRLRDVIASALANKAREFELEFRIIRQDDNEMRWIQARSSSAERALASESIRWGWLTFSRSLTGVPPILWVGESGVTSSGCSASIARSSSINAS